MKKKYIIHSSIGDRRHRSFHKTKYGWISTDQISYCQRGATFLKKLCVDNRVWVRAPWRKAEVCVTGMEPSWGMDSSSSVVMESRSLLTRWRRELSGRFKKSSSLSVRRSLKTEGGDTEQEVRSEKGRDSETNCHDTTVSQDDAIECKVLNAEQAQLKLNSSRVMELKTELNRWCKNYF